MDAKVKRKTELAAQIKNRKEDIVLAAIDEFIYCGIDNAKLTDIARKAEVGVATLYRYFENKTGLVIACAVKLWSGEIETFFPSVSAEKLECENGFEEVRKILFMFGSAFSKCPEALRLMEEFDNYIVREKVPKELLLDYEAGIKGTENFLISAIEKGKSDGSIKSDLDSQLFYATATHTITSLSQKLLLRGNIISSDSNVPAEAQIRNLIIMELEFIKN